MLTKQLEHCANNPGHVSQSKYQIQLPTIQKGMSVGWGSREGGGGKAGVCLTCDQLHEDAAYAPDVSLKAPTQAKDDFRRPVVPGRHNGAVILV